MSQVSVTALPIWAASTQVFLDVRSEGEFAQGHIPGAINVPILDNEERTLVGTTYKQQGRDKALELGYRLVSGANKDQKLSEWVKFAKQNPELILTCFRGGLRSQIAQSWLKEAGFDRPLIAGGYKACRQSLLGYMNQHCTENFFLVVSGATGAAKTHFLRQASSFWPTVDLEAHARHRGSAFGKMMEPQPQQAVFENRLLWEMLQKEESRFQQQIPFLVEDESRLIGTCVQPDIFFNNLRDSHVIWLDVPLEKRVENTFSDYVILTALGSSQSTDEEGLLIFQKYKKALSDIQRRLGGLRYQEISKILDEAELQWLSKRELQLNKVWIQRLLQEYYDPMYESSLERRQPKVYFRGTPDEALECLKGASSTNKAPPVSKKASPA